MLYQILLHSIHIPLITNFFISNGIHIFIEYIENFQNHVTDILSFILGWCISMYFKFRIPNNYQTIAWVILIFFTFKEIVRELYPYSCIGVFNNNNNPHKEPKKCFL